MKDWYLLHRLCMLYPHNPTSSEAASMRNLIHEFARKLECPHCKLHFTERIHRYPPNLRHKHSLSQWACFIHNDVNRVLGKPTFPCDINNLERHYGHQSANPKYRF